MKLKFNSDQLQKVVNGLYNRGAGKFWNNDSSNRFYLSDGICIEISSKLEGQQTVSPYFDITKNELVGNYQHDESINQEIEELAFSLTKEILTGKKQ